MKKDKPSSKEHYQKMRLLSCEELWDVEVPRFDQADSRERMNLVGLVRAVGVVFAESGSAEQKDQARTWLKSLLNDPAEKIRRYAMVALPKIGADTGEEKALLNLLDKASSDREMKFLAQTLEKIGGRETLSHAKDRSGGALERTRQKVQANLAREENPGRIRLDVVIPGWERLNINLRCRAGLESLVAGEADDESRTGGRLRVVRAGRGGVLVAPTVAVSLSDVFRLRCFSEAGLVLGVARPRGTDSGLDEVAEIISSKESQEILKALTDGPIRYRLEFASRGHQRSAVKQLTNKVYALAPHLLNDSRNAPWVIHIFHTGEGISVELSPKGVFDTRFAYRLGDIPAASHPPLAACMARLARREKEETVWDPFCGSGLELIERTLCGGVSHLYGTDRDPEALRIAQENLAAAMKNLPPSTFAECDIRDYAQAAGIRPNSISLIITNPPMGRRVPVANLEKLLKTLLSIAAVALRPGGRLVFANPLPVRPASDRLKLEFRERVDLGGFHCHLEKYVKTTERQAGPASTEFQKFYQKKGKRRLQSDR